VASAAQATEPLFADGEDDGHRPRPAPLGDGHGGRDRDRTLVAGAAVQFGQRHGIRGDRRGVEIHRISVPSH